MTPKEVRDATRHLKPEELQELNTLLAQDMKRAAWRPLPGPQFMAYRSGADIIGFGGAAGGGKTDLGCGKAITDHRKVLVLRRVGTELMGVIDRFEELIGSTDGRNGQQKVWRFERPATAKATAAPVQIEWGSLPNLGDETGFQGRPHDLLWFDEAANFLEQQVRFLLGWVRTTVAGQKQQALLTFNPPTTAEGRWIIDFFAPWLDRTHPLFPTAAGTLRYCATVPDSVRGMSRDVWLDDHDLPLSGEPFVLTGGKVEYNFDPADYAAEDVIQPKSRTFIPSRITDNPYLMGTGYLAQLQALPEPLRSQMLKGDFLAGMQDDPWQVIPTAWVDLAMSRWVDRRPRGEMLTMGVDVARGGKDNTTIARRHKTPETAHWYDKADVHPGTETPDGPSVAGLVVGKRRDAATILLDVIGVGASPYDVLNGMGFDIYGINVAEKADGADKSGKLRFLNLRSQLVWRFRELLDPANDTGAALPPDPQLAKELCAYRWELSGMTIKVESREDIIKRIGRSPDRASAYILAAMEVPKRSAWLAASDNSAQLVLDHNPYRPVASHDPYAYRR